MEGVSRIYQWCFDEVSRAFKRSYKKVTRKIKECFQEVLRVFQGNFNGVSLKFHEGGSCIHVSRVFYDFQGCSMIFKGVS